MHLSRDTQYSILLKLCIILSQIIFICLFYLFPELPSSTATIFSEPIIMIDEIPITRQASSEIFNKPLPPEIVIGEITDETELLDDIEIADHYENNSATGSVLPASNGSVPISPALPRQTLEVLPEQKEENITGSVKLYLKINEIGKVIDHRILYNSLKCENCLSEILTAAYKSRWESGRNIGHPAEYWVEKTYSFY